MDSERETMTRTELGVKIAETMAILRADDLAESIRKAWFEYSEDVDPTKDEPCELYCYIMFDDDGDLQGWTIDHAQYWPGNSGPSSAISLSPEPNYGDIEREISNDLFQAIEVEE
jgi:hypothetical protein